MPSPEAGEAVVLLHGLWCNRLVLVPLARRLQRCGYRVHLFAFPTVQRTPAENAGALERFVGKLTEPTVHFVAHSLGGLVVLRMLHDHAVTRPGRIVLLGTPLKGSRSAQRLRRWALGRRLLGRSLEQGLLSGAPRLPSERMVGVIAGRMPVGLGLVLGGVGEPSDGAVAVSETRAPGVRDHLVLATSHTGLLFSPRAARAVCQFLRTGWFPHRQ